MTSELIERARKTYNIQRRTARLRGELFHAVEIDPIDLRELITLASRASVGEDAATALKPFADCVEQINPDESDEEWAKFRLLIGDYRRAAKAIAALTQVVEGEGQAPA